MSDNWYMTTPVRDISVDDAVFCIKCLRNEVLTERTRRQEAERKLTAISEAVKSVDYLTR